VTLPAPRKGGKRFLAADAVRAELTK
jgi:hypothetical protein